MIGLRNLLLFLSLLTNALPACSQKKDFCITLIRVSEASDITLDIDILKMRFNKICASCNVAESSDSKNVRVCSSDSEQDLISETLLTAHGKVEFLETM